MGGRRVHFSTDKEFHCSCSCKWQGQKWLTLWRTDLQIFYSSKLILEYQESGPISKSPGFFPNNAIIYFSL